jgi:WD40 repeat protein
VNSAIYCLSWSPKTTIYAPVIAYAGANTLHVLNKDERMDLVPSRPFKDHIQDICFDKTEGKYLATLCDDKLLRIWTLDDHETDHVSISLTNRGVSCSFHSSQSDHL